MPITAQIKRLVVFHYHLRPGGVTTVIVDGLAALAAEWEQIAAGGRPKATIVCGSHDNVDEVRARLDAAGVDLDVVVDPLFGYAEHVQTSHDKAAIADRLVTRFRDDGAIWWIHNYHLGKNPAFTAALLDVLEQNSTQRAFLQIHDFPECARPQNLASLNSMVDKDPYPRQPNVAYVVINERDRKLLVEAGIPDRSVIRLDNPVRSKPLEPSVDAYDVRNSLAAALPSDARCYPDDPWLVYPVRCIRRKNVLEAALLAALVNANLVVTLPGTSEAEKPYSDMVGSAFADGTIAGVWAAGTSIGEHGFSFHDLVAACDVVVSSSVQEGFGFQYVSAATWGKPLFARYLDVLDGIVPVFEGFPAQFYDRIQVPFETPNLSNFRPYLQMRYREINAPGIQELLSGHLIDFSYLSGNLQLAVLKDLTDEGFRRHLQAINADLVARLQALFDVRPTPLLSRIEERFGARAFADRFGAAIKAVEAFGAAGAAPDRLGATAADPDPGGKPIQEHLVEAFATIEHSRLLYAPAERGTH